MPKNELDLSERVYAQLSGEVRQDYFREQPANMQARLYEQDLKEVDEHFERAALEAEGNHSIHLELVEVAGPEDSRYIWSVLQATSASHGMSTHEMLSSNDDKPKRAREMSSTILRFATPRDQTNVLEALCLPHIWEKTERRLDHVALQLRTGFMCSHKEGRLRVAQLLRHLERDEDAFWRRLEEHLTSRGAMTYGPPRPWRETAALPDRDSGTRWFE